MLVWSCRAKHMGVGLGVQLHVSMLNLVKNNLMYRCWCGHMLSWYAVSASTPHPEGFIHLELNEWTLRVGEMLLNKEPPPWLGILAKSSLEWVCKQSLCEMKITCCCNKILSFSPLTYTLGFSCSQVRDNLTHCVHLKGELKLLLGFDYLPSMWRCVVYVCLCYVLVLVVSSDWYSSCSDTRSLFIQQYVIWMVLNTAT